MALEMGKIHKCLWSNECRCVGNLQILIVSRRKSSSKFQKVPFTYSTRLLCTVQGSSQI